MKSYQAYHKRKNKKTKYLFLSFIIIIVGYFVIKNIPELPFLNIKKKKYVSIEQMLEKFDKEKEPVKKDILLNKANKSLNKLIEDPKLQDDGYLAYLAGTYNFRKGQSEQNKDLQNMYLDKALYYFRKAMALLQEMKNSGRLHYELGKCYFYKGEYYYYESLMELKKAKILGYNSKNIDRLIALIKFKKGDISDESYLLDQYKDSKKDNVESYFFDAVTYKNNKEYEKAKEDFLKIEEYFLKKRVENEEKKYILFKTLYSLGWLFYNEKNYNKAEEYYQKALMNEEKNADVYYWLGKVYLAQKNNKMAKKMWEKTLEINPGNKDAEKKIENLRRGR